MAMSPTEQIIQQAIEEWATVAGGPHAEEAERVTLAHYIASLLREPFRYRHGDVAFEFLPYEGWPEDVRTAAAFLLRERPDRTDVAARLLSAFSPPAERT